MLSFVKGSNGILVSSLAELVQDMATAAATELSQGEVIRQSLRLGMPVLRARLAKKPLCRTALWEHFRSSRGTIASQTRVRPVRRFLLDTNIVSEARRPRGWLILAVRPGKKPGSTAGQRSAATAAPASPAPAVMPGPYFFHFSSC
jgi:hypothetical protein